MSNPTKVPSIPPVPNDISSAKSFLSAVKETIEVREGVRGDPLDSNVTFRDLLGATGTKLSADPVTGAYAVTTLGSSTTTGGTGTTEVIGVGGVLSAIDYTVPPDVTGMATAGVFTEIIVTFTPASYSNHAFTEIWRFTADTTASKTFIGTTRSAIYVDVCGEGSPPYYYWARHISTSNVFGNFVLHGVVGNTTSTLDASYLTNASIGTAKIANLAVSDAKIASLSAAKITAGTLGVGESITVGSGGTAVVISGAGSITMGATAYNSGSGVYIGSNGTTTSFLVGDFAGNKYLNYDGANLNIKTPQFSIIAGNATFSGNLSAATGSFTGAITATSGTFSGSLSGATGTFGGALTAATGTFSGSLSAGVVDFSSAVGETHVYTPGTGFIVTSPAGKTSLRITMRAGAGGGGEGGNGLNANGNPHGGNGGSAGNVVYTETGISAGITYTINCGAGGTGAPSRTIISSTLFGVTGGTGGSCSVIRSGVTLVSATGGVGGTGGVQNGTTITNGSSGAAGTNGVAGAGGAWGPGGPGTGASGAGTNGLDGFVTVEFYDPNSVVLNTPYSNLKARLTSQLGYVQGGGD